MSIKKIPRYQAYMLRCWEEFDENLELSIWRFSLHDPRTGLRRGFANLTELVIALHTELMEEHLAGPEPAPGQGADHSA